MAQSKFSENLIRLKCSQCKRVNYYTRKTEKPLKRNWNTKILPLVQKHTLHKEGKK